MAREYADSRGNISGRSRGCWYGINSFTSTSTSLFILLSILGVYKQKNRKKLKWTFDGFDARISKWDFLPRSNLRELQRTLQTISCNGLTIFVPRKRVKSAYVRIRIWREKRTQKRKYIYIYIIY